MTNGATEASFMRSRLLKWGVRSDLVLCDEQSTNTFENLQQAIRLIDSLAALSGPVKVALITGGFHLRRTLDLARKAWKDQSRIRIGAIPAYGPNTAPKTWYKSEIGRTIIADELEKICDLGLILDSK